MAQFWAEVITAADGRCALEDHECVFAPIDAHHYVPARRLTGDALTDPRNGVALCRFHHERVENRRVECPRPPSLDQFLDDFGLLESGRPDPKRKAA